MIKNIKTTHYTTLFACIFTLTGALLHATTAENDALLEEMFQQAMDDLKDPTPLADTTENPPQTVAEISETSEISETTQTELTEDATSPFTIPPVAEPIESSDRIIATVNDVPITEGDVGARLALTLRQIGIQTLPEERKPAFIQRTLAELIEETLKTTYAKEKGSTVTNPEVLQAIRQIEQRNNMPAGGYVRLVAGLEGEAKKKLYAEILWRKTVERVVAPLVVISNKEVDRLIQQMLNHKTLVEREVAQIFLPHTEERTDIDAQILIQEILQKEEAGEEFATLAKTYSEDEAARRGGNLGWFAIGEMMPELENAAKGLKAGKTSAAIRTDAGWHILKILQTRTSNAVNIDPIHQYHTYAFTSKITGVEEEDTQIIRKLRARAFKARSRRVEDPLSLATDDTTVTNNSWQEATAYPEDIQMELNDPRIGRLTTEVVDEDAETVTVWFLKNTRMQTAPQLEEYRKRVRNRLMQQRVELEERRLLRDLKANAYVDMKLQE